MDWWAVLLLPLGLVLIVVRGARHVLRRARYLRSSVAKVFQSTDGEYLHRIMIKVTDL